MELCHGVVFFVAVPNMEARFATTSFTVICSLLQVYCCHYTAYDPCSSCQETLQAQ